MTMLHVILSFLGFCFGMLVAGGVFTVLFVVGLVPRFACKTGTARFEVWYEECIIAGTLLGCICSIFTFPYRFGTWIAQLDGTISLIISQGLLSIIGIFAGVFVGCLALALAELLDSVPIFARRVKFKKNFKAVLWGIALGKMCGSLMYFWMDF